MANNNQDWEALGRNIQDIIDQAVNSQDYRKLNQTITRTVNHAIDVGGEAVRRAVDNASRAVDNASRTAQTKQKPVIIEQREALPVLYGSTDGKTAVGIVKIVGGSLLSCFGFLGFLSTIILAAVTGVSGIPAIFGLVGLGCGVGLICSGVQGLERVGRFKKYCNTLVTRTHCSM